MIGPIVPCLWFDGQVEAAADLYTTLVPGSEVLTVSRVGTEGFDIHAWAAGEPLVVEVSVGGSRLRLLNGGPIFSPTPAISLSLTLDDAAAVDRAWRTLLDGGTELMPLDSYPWSARYGWLNDRFGVSWQIAAGSLAEAGGQRIMPSLLFTGAQAGDAEAAIDQYVAVIPDSRITSMARHDGSGPDDAGTVLHARFALAGTVLTAGGCAHPHGFGFTEGVSLMLDCDTQDEIDHLWSALSAVPEAEQCGWIKDRFGVSWQIVPRVIGDLMVDPATAGPVMQAMLPMKKIDLAALLAAASADPQV